MRTQTIALKRLLVSTKFAAALALAFLVLNATAPIASATGTIGCGQLG